MLFRSGLYAALLWCLCPLSPSRSQTPTFPKADWEQKTPQELGLDSTKLDQVRDYLGGRGFVVRFGYMAYSWGDTSRRQDIASAHKAINSYFVFKAMEEGRITNLDDRVADYASCLTNINSDLGYKDREITFYHLANQISCYGVQESPGTAYDYSDYQMALFVDVLDLDVFEGVDWQDVDSLVFGPQLTHVLQCQDDPTMIVFGVDDRPGRVGISVRDFARFGLLFLNQGNWDGQQLLSQAHAIQAVTSPLSNNIPRTQGISAEMCPGQRSEG